MKWHRTVEQVWFDVRSMFERYALYNTAMRKLASHRDGEPELSAVYNKLGRCVERRRRWSQELAECMRATAEESAAAVATAPVRSGRPASAGWLIWLTAAAGLFASGAVAGGASGSAHRELDGGGSPTVPAITNPNRLLPYYHPSDPPTHHPSNVVHLTSVIDRRNADVVRALQWTENDRNIVRIIRSIADGTHPTWRSARVFADSATATDVMDIIGPTSVPKLRISGIDVNMLTDEEFGAEASPQTKREMRHIVKMMNDKV